MDRAIRSRMFAVAGVLVAAAAALAVVIVASEDSMSSGASPGSHLEIDPFTPRDLKVKVARRLRTDSVIFGGLGVRLRGDQPVVLEAISIERIDPGVAFVRAAVLGVRENGGGFFNGTCGSLPLRASKGEWSSYPVRGFTLEADTTVVIAVEAKTSIPTGEIGLSNLIIKYRLEGASNSFQQSFRYQAVFGKQLGIECEPVDREGPLSFNKPRR